MRNTTLAVLMLTLVGCGESPTTTDNTAGSQTAERGTEPSEGVSQGADGVAKSIDTVFDEIFERELALSPIRQSFLGRKTDQLGQWDDLADERTFERVERAQTDLQDLRTSYDYESLTEQQQLSFDLFAFNVQRDVDNREFHRHAYVVDQFNGQLSGLLTVLQNAHPLLIMRKLLP